MKFIWYKNDMVWMFVFSPDSDAEILIPNVKS